MGIIQTVKTMRPRDENDHYPTEEALVRAAIKLLPDFDRPIKILDPGAGSGVWGTVARERYKDAIIVGVELDIARWNCRPESYDAWYVDNYVDTLQPGYVYHKEKYDLIIGNPPYGISNGKRDKKLAEKFVRKSFELLAPDGYILFLMLQTFRAGQTRQKHFWPKYPLKDMYHLGKRPSFTGNGKTDAREYALYLWQNNYTGPEYGYSFLWERE